MLSSGALTAYETAVGHVFGLEPSVPVSIPSRRELLEAMGDALEPHLASGPCLVWQTGDDGGALGLGSAVRRARREGLPDPIPLTLVTDPAAGDDEHVRAVVEALGLRDWVRVDATEGLDLLGPTHGRRSCATASATRASDMSWHPPRVRLPAAPSSTATACARCGTSGAERPRAGSSREYGATAGRSPRPRWRSPPSVSAAAR